MKTIVTIIALFTFTLAFANNNKSDKEVKMCSISGNVVDAQESLTGVKVWLDGKETTVYTDFDGNFTINNVVEGEHTIAFSLIAYKNKEVVLNTKSNEKVTVELNEK
jgi:hypothetical protein